MQLDNFRLQTRVLQKDAACQVGKYRLTYRKKHGGEYVDLKRLEERKLDFLSAHSCINGITIWQQEEILKICRSRA